MPSVAAITAAFTDLLKSTDSLDGSDDLFPVFESRPDPHVPLDNRGVVKGYAVLHPIAPGTDRTSLAASPGSLLTAFQVDCIGGSHAYVLDVADQVVARVDGQTLTVAGAVVGLIQPPFGYQQRAPYRDPGVAPFQLRLPLQYQVLAVPA